MLSIIKKFIDWFGLGNVILVVVALGAAWYVNGLYTEAVKLREAQLELTNQLKEAKAILEAEQRRSALVEERTGKMERDNEERAKEFRTFSIRLRNLANTNVEIYKILTTRVPDDVLRGLDSFERMRVAGPKQISKQ